MKTTIFAIIAMSLAFILAGLYGVFGLSLAVNLFFLICVISLWNAGLAIITGEGMVLHWLKRFYYYRILGADEMHTAPDAGFDDWRKYLWMPVLGCVYCMASFWGLVFCLIILPFNWEWFLFYGVVSIASSAGAGLVYKVIMED